MNHLNESTLKKITGGTDIPDGIVKECFCPSCKQLTMYTFVGNGPEADAYCHSCGARHAAKIVDRLTAQYIQNLNP